ncbi:hypothetical protein SEA_SOYO_6 [Mycobacterium phage SoYo]|uniref:Uncharacterized protein n=2 Tax=Microwolfvirus TaxID=2942894 RepID=A0A5Q2W6P2_9CAUD|nr:hypothetical protein AVT20_gp06 [Mycobacterium phage Tiffany]YP_009198434.1 hypothetical protein AVV34_gp06 [Mycobacterium phage MarQuardt]QGH73867.1 hypothetical protein SEA_GTOWNJAZ_6 [Mycobacterium phage GtownJaz]WNM68128.1 hypothetical protein SEA_SOYO_6 [Mycobacterium phage SoYo]AIK68959.1 hypothetical protein PBI_TIFFANY_6 [Mycobacterium phage Tiffany]AIM51059.1 hypothetical protein PBI_MARQUARDT_6 [Mycobacterium phage MarQuardt]
MNPDDLYTFAIRYEGQQEPDGEWSEVIALQQSLAQAQSVWADVAPYLESMPNVRNAAIVHAPKIAWIPWTE